MFDKHKLDSNTNPATLQSKTSSHDYFLYLYKKYWDRLKILCDEMRKVRKTMVENGYSADFSDREAEILYLLIRELKPDTVVEISPCHGYSTNYILTALTDNKKGKLFSYEMQTTINGKNIENVIRDNFNKYADKSRLELHVGDVMKKNIPACEFLFLDSCHEAYFAAWYFSKLVDKANLVMIHDIIIFDKSYKTLVPKAAFLGLREQYYVLQTLTLNNQTCFSVANFNESINKDFKQQLPIRNNDTTSERSIVFTGHIQTQKAHHMHQTQQLIREMTQLITIGDRETSLKKIEEIINGEYPIFIKTEALNLLPQMGYRHPIYSNLLPNIPNINYHDLTIAELVGLLEYALTSCATNSDISKIIARAKTSQINRPTFNYMIKNYLKLSNRNRLGIKNWLIKYIKKYPTLEKYIKNLRTRTI